MSESFDNKTNSHNLSVSDALGVLVSAAEARRDQYRDLSEHKGVEAATEELWDVGVTEADNMAELITSALDVFREHRDKLLDAKPPRPNVAAASSLRFTVEGVLLEVRRIADSIEDGAGQNDTVVALRKLIDDTRDRVVLGRESPIVHKNADLDDIGKIKPGRVIIGVDPAHPGADKSVMMQIKDNKLVPFGVNPDICHHPEDARRSLKSPHSGEWCDDCGAIL